MKICAFFFRCRIRFPSTTLELLIHCQSKPKVGLTIRPRDKEESAEMPNENEPESPQHLSEVEEDVVAPLPKDTPPAVSCTTNTNHRRKQLLTSILANKSLIQDKERVGIQSEYDFIFLVWTFHFCG